MKIQIQQLVPHLKKNISPIYLVSGDEFLLVQEACNHIRQHAYAAGYCEHEIIEVESGFNWNNFLSTINNSSLFGDQAIVELRLNSKLTTTGSKILQNYSQKPNTNKVLLIRASKLDSSQTKTTWFKAIESHGIFLPIWPIENTQLPSWISQRLQQEGLKTDQQGIKLLADYAAGNLLAISQEIEKLKLLHGTGYLTAEQIMNVITDNAHFNVFNLIDSALAGHIPELVRILNNTKLEGIEPIIVLWAITRELRLLINISFAVQQGNNIEQTMLKYKVWNKRQNLVKKAIKRHSIENLYNLLKQTTNIDHLVKGINTNAIIWHELANIYTSLAK